MKRSSDRILATHAGRLDGPPELRQLSRAVMTGRSSDLDAIMPYVRGAMTQIVRQQVEAGIDIVSDGELGKLGFGLAYYGRRLSGLGSRKVKPGESGWMGHGSGERVEFADFYKELGFMPEPLERAICNGPIAYIGQEQVLQDIELFRDALHAAKLHRPEVHPSEAFLCVLAPGWLEHFFANEY